MSTKPETKGDWLVSWDTEDESKWDKKLAWNTLTVTTVSADAVLRGLVPAERHHPEAERPRLHLHRIAAVLDGGHARPVRRPAPHRLDGPPAEDRHPQDGGADHPAAPAPGSSAGASR